MVIDFSPFYDFHKNIDKLLSDVWSPAGGSRGQTSYPLVNISEDDSAIYVQCEMPGVAREDLEVTIVESSLSIKGERKPAQGKYYRQERPTGVFQRLIAINTPVDPDRIKASLTDGVLSITMPKTALSKARKIAID
ncbi:Hsp20/alpha crystallin family protein [Oceanidesulfovibrio marinus]|uniref:Hsp20/alpha crystallin family protein n=1 Tax=Oceanidesulfovibrio marinus TaxID=370038 RepID=A0A6P1ZIB0_9BACT|nr:Hsp20/alpha crystallin family protein [Oceanidesulfovibrio marinus]QJT09234.1 Hsp20/alpha crystallin family protein [Oceanidesulfovibrio marinus]TVM32729.1 Hsp20/alpha crystallin family protein [Oceanidesulfovibrio marinus]